MGNISMTKKLDISDILDYVKDWGSEAGVDLMLLVGHEGVEFEPEVFDSLFQILEKDAER